MPSPHIFDSHVAAANRWISSLGASLELEPDDPRVLHALRAGMHAIRDRLPASEAVDLAAQLPIVIRGLFYEGWTLRPKARAVRDRAAMIARVERHLASEHRLDPVAVLGAVIRLLVSHVSEGEIRDVVATLPRPIAAMWQEFTGHAQPEPAAPSRAWVDAQAAVYRRRTNYSR